MQLGFRVEARHTNPLGICHGGMMASFCDMLLPMTAHRRVSEIAQRFLPTISLQIDYLAPSPLGAWVQGEAQVLRTTRTMVFAQ
ncbi:partial acyl-coenzyme A thioesterase 13, partial [Burkholderiaceae bacterium]